MSQGWAGHNYSGTKWYGRTVVPTFPGTKWTVLGWTNSWSTLGYICHKDQTFLRPIVHGLKRAGLNVTRTKGRGTKHQGTGSLLANLGVCSSLTNSSEGFENICETFANSKNFSEGCRYPLLICQRLLITSGAIIRGYWITSRDVWRRVTLLTYKEETFSQYWWRT